MYFKDSIETGLGKTTNTLKKMNNSGVKDGESKRDDKQGQHTNSCVKVYATPRKQLPFDFEAANKATSELPEDGDARACKRWGGNLDTIFEQMRMYERCAKFQTAVYNLLFYRNYNDEKCIPLIIRGMEMHPNDYKLQMWGFTVIETIYSSNKITQDNTKDTFMILTIIKRIMEASVLENNPYAKYDVWGFSSFELDHAEIYAYQVLYHLIINTNDYDNRQIVSDLGIVSLINKRMEFFVNNKHFPNGPIDMDHESGDLHHGIQNVIWALCENHQENKDIFRANWNRMADALRPTGWACKTFPEPGLTCILTPAQVDAHYRGILN